MVGRLCLRDLVKNPVCAALHNIEKKKKNQESGSSYLVARRTRMEVVRAERNAVPSR